MNDSASLVVNHTIERTTPSLERYLTRRPLVTLVVLILSVCGIAAVLLIPGTTLLQIYTWDSLAYVDAGYRMANGQIPHVDFHFPLGFLCYALPYWGLLLSGSPSGTMPMALALALVTLTPLLLYVLATRLHWFIALPVGAFLLLLIGGPINLGEDSNRVSMAMFYNSFGWAALTILMLTYIEPFKISRISVIIDGVVCGIAMLFMFYVKATYAVVGAAFLALVFVLEKDRRPGVIIGFGVLLAGALGVELLYRLHWAYYQDLLMALRASGAVRSGLHELLSVVASNVQDLALATFAVGLLALHRLLRAKDVVILLFVAGTSLLILDQNSQFRGLATIVFILTLCAERLARASHEVGHKPAWSALYAAIAFLIAFVATPIASHGGALAKHAAVPFRADTTTSGLFFRIFGAPSRPMADMPRELDGFVVEDSDLSWGLSSPDGEKLRRSIEDGNFEALRHYAPPLQQLFQTEYIATVSDGIDVLKRLAPEGKSVIVLDFNNPFSFILGLPPPRGDVLINHVDRILSRDHPIPAEEHFASATFVMIPRVPVMVWTRDHLVDAYGGYLARHFRPVAESRYWTVLRRKKDAS